MLKYARRVVDRFLSASIFIKVLGMGALVALVFGGLTVYVTRAGALRVHLQVLEHKTYATARTISESLERPLITGDLFAVREKLDRAMADISGLRYVIVRDPEGKTLMHTFEKAVPEDLERTPGDPPAEQNQVQVLASEDGRIFDITVPILNGRAGTLQVGITDRMLVLQSRILTRLILGALAFSSAIGVTLAFLLAGLIVRPLHHVEQVARRIREGDFHARSKVVSGDEIGSLALTINHMATSLERYRSEVEEKERIRAALIARIVAAQEEERKHFARELHDQLGQSLSNTLLELRNLCENYDCSDGLCERIESYLREHIDEVRRLAWDLRPAILDDYGLSFALERYVSETSKRLQIPIDYRCVPPVDFGRLPKPIEVTLYRVAQEALTNMGRHAAASRGSVVLLRKDSEVSLVLEDDGRGFDPDAVAGRNVPALGLLGMEERAALFGGEVEIESQPGAGTAVVVTIPLGEQ